MKRHSLRLIVAILALGGAALLPNLASHAFAGGPTDSGWCGHIGFDSFCVDGKATWDGTRVYQYQAAVPYTSGPGNYSYYDRSCGQYYSSDGHKVDNIPNYYVVWCNYTVYPQDTYLYPRAYVYPNGYANGYDG